MPDKLIHIKLDEHINNFSELSVALNSFINSNKLTNFHGNENLYQAIENTLINNGFFTHETVFFALKTISEMLEKSKLEKWTKNYLPFFESEKSMKNVGVVMAGNIPLVGFHDFLCVLITGNKFIGKLSQNDRFLLPAIAGMLKAIDIRYENFISFTEDKLKDFDAVIATGSTNTSRYFEYYFGKYPHIIRKNRNSIAVLIGDETEEQLCLLADDMFSYFGLGCRSVSKIFVPEKYDFQKLIRTMHAYSYLSNHNKFRNNYDYYKTIFIMNQQKFIDGGFFILNEDTSLHSPVSVINYEYYSDIEKVKSFINEYDDKIQCVVESFPSTSTILSFGRAQHPELWDYADNIDTLSFLFNL